MNTRRPFPSLLVPALLTLFALLICLRMPEIVIKGRFWAEEGNVFFYNAWTMKPLQALLTSYGGYLNLAANAASLAARWLLPLRLAPYLTIAVGLLFQLCPLLLLFTARDEFLAPIGIRIAAALLILLIPDEEEVWLQSLHCQFQLALCCGIILALDPVRGLGRLFRFMLLCLAPLCGPVSIALLPLFVARAALDRAWARVWQALALAAGAALQLTLFFHPVPGRGYSLDPVTLLDIITIRHLYVPFLGVPAAWIYAPLVKARLLSGHVPLRATLLPILVFAPFLLATLWERRRRPAFWLLAAGGLLACAMYFGVIGGAVSLIVGKGGDRYIFAPQALFALSALALAATAQRWTRLLAGIAVLWLLAVGGVAYFTPWSVIADGPPWRREVAAWQADPSHKLRLWPDSPNWNVSLPRR
jgi:hypothetical protein